MQSDPENQGSSSPSGKPPGADEDDQGTAQAVEPVPPAVTVEGLEKGNSIVLQETLPTTLFVLPLRRAVPFPNLVMPVLLDTPLAREIAAKAEAHNGHLLLLTQRDPEVEPTDAKHFYSVGVLAKILKVLKLPDGNATVMAQGLRRARVERFVRRQPFFLARIEVLLDIPARSKRGKALFKVLQGNLKRLVEIGGSYNEDFGTAVINIDRPEQLADFCGSYFVKEVEGRQQLLEAIDVDKRLEIAVAKTTEDLQVAELGQKIQAEIRAKTEKAQKEYFLREQIKIIRRELGEEVDARQSELQRIEAALESARLPDAAHSRAEEELNRLRTTPAESPEYGVIRNYLDWLTTLPWSVSSDDRRDLQVAAKVLDEDHYGLEEVKARILEFLAVRKLKPAHQGSILCFAGPPGVGKTSLGRSIARAMGRQFWRFSLGGMRDEAEIKGHRRTYVGAMPGRILQGLKACQTNNPVIVLDEIDKLGQDYRGDPSSALLEVLDPEQNVTFLDHYLDVPFDLSRVMFIATANALPQIPEPLRDRMEVIEIPGYVAAEKVEIALRHLVPKQLERHGLGKRHLSFGKPVLRQMVQLYTREAGVRGLEKSIQRVCRKAALAVASRKKPPGRLSLVELERALGQPRYLDSAERKMRVPGVSRGLAWTPHGGDVLYIEAAATPGKGGLTLTGRLGDVMTESVRIAVNCVRGRAARYGIAKDWFESRDIHVHFPAGAIPKDGPSAGIAVASALVSLATGKRFPPDLAMTGEVTLVGEVLGIGGVREKVLAAQRYRLRRVILPMENKRDVAELKKDMTAGLKLHFVERFDEVVKLVFAD
ncbi:MAG: endopeptidase La [Planctomycetota bacterium]